MTPLKLGIVGVSEPARPLAEEVLASAEFQLLGYHVDVVPDWFTRLLSGASRETDPLPVINLPGLEVLLVLGPVADLKSAITAAIAQRLKVIVLPLAELESTFAYDLSVTAIDDGAPLFPCFTHRFAPALQNVRGELFDASLVEIECDMPRRAANQSLDWPEVRQSLLTLADLVCWIWGDYRRMTTVTAGPDAERPTRVTVNLGGEACPDVVISFRPSDAAACRMNVQHPAGATTIDLAASHVEAGLLKECWLRASAIERSAGSTWSDLMRAFDLLDASQRSIRRKRTVEVSRESASERSQFKTQMTTAGCGVLTFTLCAVLLLLIVGSVLDPRDSQQRESEALGLMLHDEHFDAKGGGLTDEANSRLREMSNAMTASTAVLLVEANESEAVNQQRADTVAESLTAAGVENAQSRVIVRPLAGGTIRGMLIVGWILGFLPLAIYLLLQSLIIITAQGSERSSV